MITITNENTSPYNREVYKFIIDDITYLFYEANIRGFINNKFNIRYNETNGLDGIINNNYKSKIKDKWDEIENWQCEQRNIQNKNKREQLLDTIINKIKK